MSEMIERVARALAGNDWREGTYVLCTGKNFEPEEHDADKLNNIFRHQARAAIEAMKVPTEAMVAAAMRPLRGQEGFHNELPFEQQWRHAIDAALR